MRNFKFIVKSFLLIIISVLLYESLRSYHLNMEKFEQGRFISIPGKLTIKNSCVIKNNLNTKEIQVTDKTNSKIIETTNLATDEARISDTLKTNDLSCENLTTSVLNHTLNKYSVLPSGSIILWSEQDLPKGWILCDGNNNTPDLRGRFVMGMGDKECTKCTGGNEYIKLTDSQMPAHYHTGSTDKSGSHRHWTRLGGTDDRNWSGGYHHGNQYPPGDAGPHGHRYNIEASHSEHTHPFTTNYVGANELVNILPEHVILSYIMKI